MKPVSGTLNTIMVYTERLDGTMTIVIDTPQNGATSFQLLGREGTFTFNGETVTYPQLVAKILEDHKTCYVTVYPDASWYGAVLIADFAKKEMPKLRMDEI